MKELIEAIVKCSDKDTSEVEKHIIGLNINELRVLKALSLCDEYGDRPTGDADYLAGEFSVNQVKGYLSSLSKKKLIIDCEMPNGRIAWQLLDRN